MKDAKALTITYLTPVSFASLNGSDKEADNISNIKKITRETEQFPYVSAQAVRRALRDQLVGLGYKSCEIVKPSEAKAPVHSAGKPFDYIEDDLFGFMDAKGRRQRTSPVRVSPLISLQKYEGDLDFGTNYMGKAINEDPSIMETEIHAGLYRGTVLIELDRIGCGEGFEKNKECDSKEKDKRLKDFLSAFKNLWSSGRQSRFLADISPKFIAAAMLTTKNPIFLESVITVNGGINSELLNETIQDYKNEIQALVIGARKGLFSNLPNETISIGDAFNCMMNWVDEYYK
jgi:CRISPR-associated protein Cst2